MIPSLLPVYQTLFAISLIVIGIAVVALAWQQRRADNAESKCCKALDEATNWKTVAKLYERTLRMALQWWRRRAAFLDETVRELVAAGNA